MNLSEYFVTENEYETELMAAWKDYLDWKGLLDHSPACSSIIQVVRNKEVILRQRFHEHYLSTLTTAQQVEAMKTGVDFGRRLVLQPV